jgi:Rps23 Pro-64 3,4-dihydroxylase Tpa1-like proline 4-hydroxylase
MAYFQTVHDVFGHELREQLLQFALDNEHNFVASRIGIESGRIDESKRMSRRLPDLGALKPLIEARFAQLVPQLVHALGLRSFAADYFESELVAHGHGAFYRRHVDVFGGGERKIIGADRMLSFVYYFFQEPCHFTGGRLRVYPTFGWTVGAGEDEPVDVDIQQDMAVAFPPWVPHEVLPVACASGRFEHSRFAINCWAMQRLQSP